MISGDIKEKINAMNLKKAQHEAVVAVFDAIMFEQDAILVEMLTGTGKAATIQAIAFLLTEENNSLLILTDRKEAQLNLEKSFKEAKLHYDTNIENDFHDITIITQQTFLQHASRFLLGNYNYILCCDADTMHSDEYEETLAMSDATIIAFSSIRSQISLSWFSNVKPVYSNSKLTPFYTEADATKFLHNLFQYSGITNIEIERTLTYQNKSYRPDIVMQKDDLVIIAEIKLYRSSHCNPSMLELAAIQIHKYKTIFEKSFQYKQNVCIDLYLIAFCFVEDTIKERFFLSYNINILDVSNLLYLSQSKPEFLKQLAQLLPYSLDQIPFIKPKQHIFKMADIAQENMEKPENCAVDFISELKSCRAGNAGKASQHFEQLCTNIIHYLFSTEFSKERKEYKTSDNLFRMDMLCALKGNAEFWKFLIKHYNTKFVVFEYKNFSKKIPQNLIYITEKYLFDAALRNVAFIISRKGFDTGAKRAALGCLKEHKKLIIDLMDDDLIHMLEKKRNGEDPSDYLLSTLEDYLMSIGK